MKNKIVLFLVLIISNISFGQLIISQVYEGVNDNKWIEVTNTGTTSIDLSSPIQYKVGIWQQSGSSGNGIIFGSPTSSISLSGTLARGQKYFIKHTNAASNVPHAVMPTANNANTTVASFDGNDALAIFTDTNSIIDAFGVGINTSNVSYTRGSQIVKSSPTFIATQWTSETLAYVSTLLWSSSNSYIGTHNFRGVFYSYNELASINKEYGAVSPIESFVLTRTNSEFYSFVPGIAPPPPGITPPTILYAPTDFEFSLSPNFSTAIGTSTVPLVIDTSNSINFTKTIYYRLVQNASVGNKTGNVFITLDFPNPFGYDVLIPTNAINLVSAKSVVISDVMANDKVYNGNTLTTLSGTPVLNGVLPIDTANVVLTGSPVAHFSDALSGTNKAVSVVGYILSGSAATNYTVQQPTGLVASILPSGLLSQTISFDSIPSNWVYGDASFTLAATSTTGLPVVFTSSNPNIISISGTTATIVGAGEVVITASQLGNTEYEAALDSSQTITVLPKELTVSELMVNDKTYDATTAATTSNGFLNGVINSDEVSFTSVATFADESVGNAKNVTIVYALSGSSSANYFMSNDQQVANILPVQLTINEVFANSKSYDGTDNATLRGVPVLSGLLTSDVFSVTIAGSPVAVFEDSLLGLNKPVSVTGYFIEGVSATNYVVVQPTNLVADIIARPVTISGVIVSDKVYDRTTTASFSGTPVLNGIVVGEESAVVLSGTLSATFDTFNVGTNKTVTFSGVSLLGVGSENYTLETLISTASILKKQLTIGSPVVADKTYDGNSTALLTGILEGVITPDTILLNTTAVFSDSNVGQNKSVTSTSTISGSAIANYMLVQPQGLTASILATPCSVNSGYAYWNGTSTTLSTSTYLGVVISSIERGNNNGTNALISTSSPSNYSGASGTSNFTASAFVGALNSQTSTYFQFTITPNSNVLSSVSEVRFGSRSNSNGPQTYALRSSVDNYTSTIASGILTANGLWSINTLAISQTPTSSPVTYRLYGYGGAGSNSTSIANWRIDDLRVTVSLTSAPALSSSAFASACSNAIFSYTPTTNYENATISWTRPAVAGISNAAVIMSQNTNPSETLINTTTSPIDVVYQFSVNSANCSLNQAVTVTVNPSNTWYQDGDGDGFGNGGVSQISCDQPSGYVLDGADCDDAVYSLTNSCATLLNLKLFVQGYYTGQNQMNSSRVSQNTSNQAYVDDLTVELHDATTLNVIETTVTSLNPDGSAQCLFSSVLNGNYYIAVRSSNSLKTWSSSPLTFESTTVDYDFSNDADKAFGANMVEVSSGVWAFISGDINDDGIVDNSDYSTWETDSNAFAFGVYATDLNGDGIVDNSDYSIWEANANSFVFSITPTP